MAVLQGSTKVQDVLPTHINNHRSNGFVKISINSKDLATGVRYKVPYFTLLLSITQFTIFHLPGKEYVATYFLFDPFRRYEIWRFLTLMFFHRDTVHIRNNVTMQLLFGSLLEAANPSRTVAVVYLAGILFGTLAASVIEPWDYLVGASAGVCALITANLSAIILNWRTFRFAFTRFVLILLYIGYVVWESVAERLKKQASDSSVSSHCGGALAGLLVGIASLTRCEGSTRTVCRYLAFGYILITVTANICYQLYYFIADADVLFIQ